MALAKVVKTAEETRADMLEALKHVSEEKNIPVETLIESIEGALVSAYKRAFGGTGTVRIAANFEKNEFSVFAQKLVVQRAINTNTEVSWKEAREQDPNVNLGDVMEREVTPAGFGRIAALTAKQVLMQKLREAERVQVVSEYADKQGQLFRGVVQRIERGDVIMQVGKAEAMLPRKEQAQGEAYRFGETYFVFVVDVRQGYRGPSIIVSRTHPGLVKQLFTREVPEITDGIVELKAVAREAGQRSKIAVAASNPDVDPVGACVGPRGNRVSKVVAELGNEKVDIVRWNADPILYITNALSPAQIAKVITVEETGGTGTATVIVSEDQQSLAIGKQGQNVRLAAKLTGWRIDIRTEKQYAEEQAKKMFSLGTPVTAPVSIRESAGELDKLFSLDGDTDSDDTQSPVSDASASEAPLDLLDLGVPDAGSAAPISDVKLFAIESDDEAADATSDGATDANSEEEAAKNEGLNA